MINSKPSVDGVNSGWQNGPDRSNIFRTWTHRLAWISGDGDDVSICYASRFAFSNERMNVTMFWLWYFYQFVGSTKKIAI